LKYAYTLIAFLLVISLHGPVDLWAQEGRSEISVTAASMRTMTDGTLTAEGEVLVKGEGVNVRADNLKYDPGSDTLMLTGNVVMEEAGGGAFTGDALALDLADLTGGISRGEIIIVPNGFRVRGEDINRLGPEEYSVSKGVFTSCPGDCPDWSFTASKIQVRKEGYLEARHAAFRILGVPVFYTPYLLYPVKTKRQTGLLFPEFSFSDEKGLGSSWPVFITLGPNADATVSPITFSRDSFGLDLESRYRLDWGGGGQIKGFAMTGERSERWYLGAEHSMALTPDLWLRGRWYDAGEPTVGALFGDTFDERHPGAVYRHISLEGDHGVLGYNFQASSLLTDGALARSDIPGTVLDRDVGVVRFGPGGGDLWRIGVEAEDTHFDGGERRTLVSPTLALWIPGPGKMAGHIQGRGIIGTGGEGSIEDEAYLVSVSERVGMESIGSWGRHRVDLELTASAAQGASFGGSVLRDSKDLVEERRMFDARIYSRLTSPGFKWDLAAGSWQDHELDLAKIYAMTRLSYSGMFMEASKNRDVEFGMVLPSISFGGDSYKGWQVEAGYESGLLGFALGRDSTEGAPEMFTGKGHFTLAGVRVWGVTSYDMDADSVTDETIEVQIPGRCWNMTVGRSRSPDRTDWSMQLELGL
jgi:hypothetical protein